MIRNFIDSLKGLSRSPVPVDPTRFDDPIATKTNWNPAKPSGDRYCTYKLVKENNNRVVFEATYTVLIANILLIVIGLGLAWITFKTIILNSPQMTTFSTIIEYMKFFVGVGVAGGCSYIIYVVLKPNIFDKSVGYYWNNYKSPKQSYNQEELDKFISLHKIHALQLVSEMCYGGRVVHYSYELNLVLDDGTRINVIDHGNKEKLRDDARRLSLFLGVPVWDAI